MTVPFLIDTDTASDDAVALIMALQDPNVSVEAITVVAGNVPVDQGVRNALHTVDMCAARVPVYRGMDGPLLRPLETAENVHGQDGLGDIGLPDPKGSASAGHAVDIIIETINRLPGEVTLVSLGPLTNIAMAVKRDPTIAGKVRRYVMMGGTWDSVGNVTPVAEYNIWVDPEAAEIVFHAGFRLTMAGWDISRKYAVFRPKDQARIRAIGTRLADFSVAIQARLNEFALSTTHLEGFDLPDPIAMAIALRPEVATRTEDRYVAVALESEMCRGQTVVDHLGVTGRTPNVTGVVEASRTRFLDVLFEAVERPVSAG
ncbi:MAG TPA: nucleoside hydrolase [Chloroflexota bacterium]|nr:nucleoside hydrolase [Chloroflexota bacterium]